MVNSVCEHDRCPWCGACHDIGCFQQVKSCDLLEIEIELNRVNSPMKYYRDNRVNDWIYQIDDHDKPYYPRIGQARSSTETQMVRALFMWIGVTNFYQDIAVDYLENSCTKIDHP